MIYHPFRITHVFHLIEKKNNTVWNINSIQLIFYIVQEVPSQDINFLKYVLRHDWDKTIRMFYSFCLNCSTLVYIHINDAIWFLQIATLTSYFLVVVNNQEDKNNILNEDNRVVRDDHIVELAKTADDVNSVW